MTNKKILSHEWLVSKMLENQEVKAEVERLAAYAADDGPLTAQKLKAFKITRYLDSKEAIAEYLSQVLEDGDNEELIRSLGHIAKVKDSRLK